jgi:4-hydroxy-tetrahydrodipicolinate reductase
MNIALIGYGRMGKSIEKIALERGHQIGQKIDGPEADLNLKHIDIAIDFSLPESAFNNIKSCIDQDTPVISGTTGWLDQYEDIVEYCNAKKGTFLYASNFSLGVNIFFKLNEVLAGLMKQHSQYTTAITEVHHTKKLDAPSGTAITLAEQIIAESEYENWTLDRPQPKELGITSKRIEDVPGTHTIAYQSSVDTLQIEHVAHNRSGFALGAVIAAEWIVDKQGVFSMKDVLNLG